MHIHADDIHAPGKSYGATRPLFQALVPAGFPSPADDYIERELDLNAYLIKHPAATFFVRVTGDSMSGAGIRGDDDRKTGENRGRYPISSPPLVPCRNDSPRQGGRGPAADG